jgi:DNA (cytosine-5)-methyltransferase 1
MIYPPGGLVVDLFAGGGGASVAIEAALGRIVDLAVNHDAIAIAVHRANHPWTRHLEANVWEVRRREATGGQPVDLLWASPDCRHFSRAKGSAPVSKGVRSLAWVIVDWAREVRPRVICLENVREFQTWGPLLADGRPDPNAAGQHYDEWTEALRRLGYSIDSRLLDASLYGAPTKRVRLFVVARCDGEPIRWPAPTHGPGLLPVRAAAECIDWSLPCPSIFDRKRPLAPATQRRIAEGIRRFVLETADPFIVLCNHGKPGFRGQPLSDPMRTITAAHDARGIVVPTIMPNNTNNVPKPADAPLPTVTGGNRNYLVSAFIAKHYGGVTGIPAAVPLGTVTSVDHHSLVAATLTKFQQNSIGQDPREPMHTVLAGAPRFGLVSAFLSKFYGTATGSSAQLSLPTITAGAGGGHHGLVAAAISKYYGAGGAQSAGEPLHTQSTHARFALVAAFLQEHGVTCGDPATVTLDGVPYAISDIGLRMLEPHELLRAQFGQYADGYDLSAAKSKAAKIRLIGNSVCPDVARALVDANVSPRRVVAGPIAVERTS